MLGWGAGLFFISYFFFEVPSNLMLHKFGARRWIARVMISMGLVSMAFVFVQGAWSLYLMRLLLGIAEAGLFPGIIFYITLWFPKQWRGRVTAAFVAAIPVSSFIAGPLSGALLQLDGVAGLAGWQWMFILEALPALVIGFVTLRYLTSTPAEATWLSPDERDWLIERLRSEQTDTKESHGLREVFGSLVSWQVIRLALIYFGLTTGLYGIELWMPLIIKGFGLGTMAVGLVSAIPYLVALGRHGALGPARRQVLRPLRQRGLALRRRLLRPGRRRHLPRAGRCWSSPSSRWRSPASCRPGRPSGPCRPSSSRAGRPRPASPRSTRSAISAASPAPT